MSSREDPMLFELTSAIVSDSLDRAGLRHQVCAAGIRPLDGESRLVGRAATVQFAECDEDEADDPYGTSIDFIDSLASGEVVIAGTAGSDRSAVWGELFSAAAKGRGVAGVVTDGHLRDTSQILGLGFPAFSRGTRPIDYRARQRIVATRRPLTLGGVVIADGDLIIADRDGIVTVPSAAESEVLAYAFDRLRRETTVLSELVAGESLRAVWERHQIL